MVEACKLDCSPTAYKVHYLVFYGDTFNKSVLVEHNEKVNPTKENIDTYIVCNDSLVATRGGIEFNLTSTLEIVLETECIFWKPILQSQRDFLPTSF